ncbi:biotin/lipoyl-containing protein [Streptomyces sp. NEAU-S7GS2]|uniref:biotin/lipoyl-containing protein n=1 Tax=Streptomyces sp. NEAU-S7GS2 TaxID=2202000 RepID=UPI001EF721A2|nr:biotin/lipoyl-containing protein [Streptomyces sp. NEAU-S7GS2]
MLQEWLVRPGDRVRKGDPVAVVETGKSAVEVESFETGTVGQLLVELGTTVPVGTPLALIESAEEPATSGKPGEGAEPTMRRKAKKARPKVREAPERGPRVQPAPGSAEVPEPSVAHRAHAAHDQPRWTGCMSTTAAARSANGCFPPPCRSRPRPGRPGRSPN